MSATVGITGAAGYIGSRLVADCLEAGHDVVALDDFSSGSVREVRGTPIRSVDVRDRDALRSALANVDVVVHLAAISGVPECESAPERAFDVNVGGTENVAWLCRETGTPLSFASSMAVVGDPEETPITAAYRRAPMNLYGLTKKLSEDDVADLSAGRFPAHVLLKSNLYGRHRVDGRTVGKDTVVNVFVERALAGDPLDVHEPGTQARDFVHVADVSRAYLRSVETLLDAEPGATTLPIASGEQYSVAELADLVRRVAREELNRDVAVRRVPNPRDAEALAPDFGVDTDSARDRIGFEATHTVEETVRQAFRNA